MLPGAEYASTILIADMTPTAPHRAAYLEDSGYAVIVAGNGKDALFSVRLTIRLLLDVMPEMDGFEAARLIRESAVPIIMLGRDDERIRPSGLS
jgi:DNA-binding response OmpR family regulator